MKEYFKSGFIIGQRITLFMLFIIYGLSYTDLFSQNVQTKPSRQSSLEAFSDGKYELAYDQFSELLVLYPKDPLYKYYSGVCLVKLNRDPGKASSLIQDALQSAAIVRSVPDDAFFYLGRAQQMSGRFSEAVESYTRFGDLSGKKVAKELGVPGYIQQCNNKMGQLLQSVTDNSTASVKEDTGGKNNIQQPVSKDDITKTDLPADYEKILNEALNFQFKADSLGEVAAKQKQRSGIVPDNQKASVKLLISATELKAASYQKEADRKFKEAEFLKNGKLIKEQITGSVIDSSKNSVTGSNNVLKITEFKGPVIAKDTIRTVKENHQETGNAQQSKNTGTKVQVIKTNTTIEKIPENVKTVEIFSVFEVIKNPVFKANDKITINPEVPEGLVYRIQLAVFRNPVAPSFFKGITPVYGFRVTGSDRTNYYAGMFRRSADAAKVIPAVKSKGFKDAFVVAFSGIKPISAERASVLEKQWGKQPLIKNLKASPETIRDTVPPALSFRVEVIRSEKPLKDEMNEGIKKAAGSRGMDIKTADDGKIVYLIGNFITFESAAEYADLLNRNGYREAKVVAWLGEKEIPLETAKQLFKQLE